MNGIHALMNEPENMLLFDLLGSDGRVYGIRSSNTKLCCSDLGLLSLQKREEYISIVQMPFDLRYFVSKRSGI